MKLGNGFSLQHVKAILFDLDGTLIDSVREVALVLNEMRNSRDLPSINEREYSVYVSHGANALVKFALPYDCASLSDLVHEFREKLLSCRTDKTSVFPGAYEVLTVLRNKGILLGLCTNKPSVLCERVLNDVGLSEFFNVVVAAGERRRLKPHPEPIDYAISLMNVTRECVVLIGDSTIDQQAAEAAGIPFLFFMGGYNDGVDLQRAAAVIQHLKNIVEILDGFVLGDVL